VKDQIKCLLVASAILLLAAVIVAPVASAQEKAQAPASSQHPTGGTPSKSDEEEKFPEVEVVASNNFRSLSLIVRLFRGLNIEGHYFDRSEPEGAEGAEAELHLTFLGGIRDMGTINGSYRIRLGEHDSKPSLLLLHYVNQKRRQVAALQIAPLIWL